jgi:hypothetical protein
MGSVAAPRRGRVLGSLLWLALLGIVGALGSPIEHVEGLLARHSRADAVAAAHPRGYRGQARNGERLSAGGQVSSAATGDDRGSGRQIRPPRRRCPSTRRQTLRSGSAFWTIFATVDVGLGPVKDDENRREPQCGGGGEIELTSGAVEAEQLCDPERA